MPYNPYLSRPPFPYVLDTESEYYKAFIAAGFHSLDVHRIPSCMEYAVHPAQLETHVYIQFLCVCGTKEIGFIPLASLEASKCINGNRIDMAKYLERIGQLSEVHLKKDGYTEEQICDIRKPFEELYNEIIRLHP